MAVACDAISRAPIRMQVHVHNITELPSQSHHKIQQFNSPLHHGLQPVALYLAPLLAVPRMRGPLVRYKILRLPSTVEQLANLRICRLRKLFVPEPNGVQIVRYQNAYYFDAFST